MHWMEQFCRSLPGACRLGRTWCLAGWCMLGIARLPAYADEPVVPADLVKEQDAEKLPQKADSAAAKTSNLGKATEAGGGRAAASQVSQPSLTNLLRVSDQIFCGGEPHDEAAFRAIQQLGCRAIVSVDGATPQVALAKRFGLRYVHIPIGYGGVTAEEADQITAVVRQVEGPYYVHCHHGKHRGPAAAAMAAIAAGTTSHSEAMKILERAGTDKNYDGLWRSVSAFVPPDKDAPLPKLVEVARVNSVVAAMSQIDRVMDNLKRCQTAGWKSPADHPDLQPVQQALLLKEAFRELCRHLATETKLQTRNPQFAVWMRESETSSERLRVHLAAGAEDSISNSTFQQLQDQCRRCHQSWR